MMVEDVPDTFRSLGNVFYLLIPIHCLALWHGLCEFCGDPRMYIYF